MNHKMNYMYHFSLIICGAWIFLTSLPRDVSSQSHNFECSSSSSCDSSKHLECDSFRNTCDCPKTMEWSENLLRCVMKEGQKCETGNSNESPCTQHSSCISGVCECDVNYLRNGFGSCFLGYDLPCNNSHSSSEGQCALRYGLDCVEDLDVGGGVGRCRCRGESVDFVWDEYRQKCVSLVGTTCDGEEGDRRDDKLECVQNADCINRICTCKPEFSSTPDRKCLKSYGEKCDNSEGDFCNRYALLNCGDGKCGCEFYGQMDYDEKVGECRMLVGEMCEMLKPGGNLTDGHVLHKCLEDAVCVLNPKYKHTSSHANAILKGKCSCGGGKIKTSDGKCTNLRRHNMSCSFAGDCDKSQFLTCFIDEERGGLCSCPPGEMFFDGSTCLSLPGKRCSEGRKCGRNSTCNDGQFCSCNEDYNLDAEHMTCRPRKSATITTSPSTTTTSTTRPTTLSPVRKEVPADWETRSGGAAVYSVGGDAPVVVGVGGCTGMDEKSLEFQRCSCEFVHSGVKVWSEEKASCLALVGAACELDEHCIELAYCEMEDRVCQCLVEEARSTLNNTCVPRRRRTHEPVIKDEYGGYVNERSRGVPEEDHPKQSGRSNEAAEFSTFKYLTSLTVIPFIFNVIILMV